MRRAAIPFDFYGKLFLPLHARGKEKHGVIASELGENLVTDNVESGPIRAGFWRRAVAFLVDVVIVAVPMQVIVIIMFALTGGAVQGNFGIRATLWFHWSRPALVSVLRRNGRRICRTAASSSGSFARRPCLVSYRCKMRAIQQTLFWLNGLSLMCGFLAGGKKRLLTSDQRFLYKPDH